MFCIVCGYMMNWWWHNTFFYKELKIVLGYEIKILLRKCTKMKIVHYYICIRHNEWVTDIDRESTVMVQSSRNCISCTAMRSPVLKGVLLFSVKIYTKASVGTIIIILGYRDKFPDNNRTVDIFQLSWISYIVIYS